MDARHTINQITATVYVQPIRDECGLSSIRNNFRRIHRKFSNDTLSNKKRLYHNKIGKCLRNDKEKKNEISVVCTKEKIKITCIKLASYCT